MSSFRWPVWGLNSGLPVVALCLAVGLMYAPFLSNPLVFDDVYLFLNPDTVRDYVSTASFSSLRWLPYASLSWTANWFGFDVANFRIGNLLLHAANAIALFAFLRRLFALALTAEVPQKQVILSRHLAFLGALIFALHPVAVYGVAYLIQRTILMATLFTLLMLLAYMQGIERDSKAWFVLAALFYLLAVFSKEHAVMAPVVGLMLTWLVRQPYQTLLKRALSFYSLAFVIAVIVVLKKQGLLGVPYELYGQEMLRDVGVVPENAYLLSVATQSYLYFKYLLLWGLPNPVWMSVDMREPFAISLLGWPHTAGVIAFLVYPALAVWLLSRRGKYGLLGFSMLFPWLMFLTELSAVRIQEPFVLYRSYLWMVGVFAAMPVLWGWMELKKVYLFFIAVGVLLVPMTLDRLSTFSHPYLLWDDAEKLVHGKEGLPGIDRIYYNRGTELIALQRYEDAIADFNVGLAANPKLDHLYGNRGSAFLHLEKYPEALRDYDKAIELNAENSKYYYGRGLILQKLHNIEAARTNFQKSCDLANRGCNKLKELPQTP